MRSDRTDWEQGLRSGRLDLVLDPVEQIAPDLVRRPVLSDRFAVLLRRDHPALSLPWTDTVFAGGRHAQITPSDQAELDRELARRGLVRQIRMSASSALVIAVAAAQTDLRVVVRSRLAHHLARILPLAVRPLPLPVRPAPISLVWHLDRSADARHRWLRELVAREVQPPIQPPPHRGGGSDNLRIIQAISTTR